MAHWNMFSAEVAKERQTVRAYGLEKIADRLRHSDSYKAQALRELAMRLEYAEQVKELNRENGRLIDRLEAAELERDLAKQDHHTTAPQELAT